MKGTCPFQLLSKRESQRQNDDQRRTSRCHNTEETTGHPLDLFLNLLFSGGRRVEDGVG